MEPRAVRFLCWEPFVADDSRFHSYLDQEKLPLSPRSIQGLVLACHQRWSVDLCKGYVGVSLRSRLQNYASSNRVVAKWKENPALIVGPDGPYLFADEMIRRRASIEDLSREWLIPDRSAFLSEAVKSAAHKCRRQVATLRTAISYLTDHLLRWGGWAQSDFKDELSKSILLPETNGNAGLLDGLKKVALDTLGDPRLPANQTRWYGVSPAARNEVLRWLSREDIVFFFEHAFPRGQDPHQRKDFWLKYVKSVKQSRPLLSHGDRGRLRALSQATQQRIGHYGAIDENTSAFLLDFGRLLVIEFSQTGNACYIYDARAAQHVIPDFWSERPFRNSQLKQKPAAIDHITHSYDWREKIANILAQHGVRPA